MSLQKFRTFGLLRVLFMFVSFGKNDDILFQNTKKGGGERWKWIGETRFIQMSQRNEMYTVTRCGNISFHKN